MKLILIIFIVLVLFSSATALEYNKAIYYIGKNILITYSEFGAVITDYGKVITVIEDNQDFTVDKMYSLLVLYNYKAELKTIKISKIKYIRE